MKIMKGALIGGIFFLFSQTLCFSIDPSIYWGTWKTKGNPVDIELIIGDDDYFSLKINKKKIEHMKAYFAYPTGSDVPYLYISLVDKYKYSKETLHSLYLVIGSAKKFEEGGPNYNILLGFYLYEKVVNDHYGETHGIYYPIELRKIAEKKDVVARQ